MRLRAMPSRVRHVLLTVVALVVGLAIAIPVLGADPSPSAGVSPVTGSSPSAAPPVQAEPSVQPEPTVQAAEPSEAPESAKPDKTAKPDKADKEPEVTVTVTGTVKQGVDGQGRPSFSLTDGSKTWELSAGPPWFWGDKNPLKAYAGKSVTIVGSSEEGGAELDVETVNGTAIRAPGKPPWAGGPWVVGPTHPGWKPWMANGKPGKGVDGAPGQNKDKTPGG